MTSELRPSDDPLDRQLRDVPIPEGLRARLTIEIWADEEIDRRLKDVPIPFGLKYRMREIASTPHWRSRGMVAAAALFLFVSCWQIGSMLTEYFIVTAPQHYAKSPLDSWMPRPEEPRIVFASQSSPILPYRPYILSPIEHRYWRPINAVADAVALQRREMSLAYERLASRSARGHAPNIIGPLANSAPFALIADAGKGSLDGVRGAPPVAVETGTIGTEVRPLAWRMPRGVDPALNADDRRFLLETGSFPFVQPREFPTSSVPLVLHTTAFEVARASLAAGEAPPIDRMRAEEFLAAADYRFPRPAAGTPLRLSAYGAIAPWSPIPPVATTLGATTPAAGNRTGPTGGAANAPPVPPERIGRLLQLGVQAGELPAAAKRKPTHLTVGVDVSATMRDSGRLEMVKHALVAVIRKLEAADRMTIVAVGGRHSTNQEAATFIEDAGRAELEQLLAAVDWLSEASKACYGEGSLSSGVIATLGVAACREPPRDAQGRFKIERRVIVFTDSCGEFDPRGIRLAEQLPATPAMEGIRLDMVDVSGDHAAGDNEENAWEDVVRKTDGRVFRAETADRMRSILMEGLTGRNQRLASDVVLSITFNPQAVVGYRLIGHEPTALAAVAPPKPTMDFNAGQSGSMLFEVRLNGGKESQVATAVLRWRDPTDGNQHESVQVITRGMLGGTWEKASPTLQMAAIATSTAALLRNSPWGDHVAPGEALQWARRLERARTGRDVAPWVAMLEQMQKLPPRRGNARARSVAPGR